MIAKFIPAFPPAPVLGTVGTTTGGITIGPVTPRRVTRAEMPVAGSTATTFAVLRLNWYVPPVTRLDAMSQRTARVATVLGSITNGVSRVKVFMPLTRVAGTLVPLDSVTPDASFITRQFVSEVLVAPAPVISERGRDAILTAVFEPVVSRVRRASVPVVPATRGFVRPVVSRATASLGAGVTTCAFAVPKPRPSIATATGRTKSFLNVISILKLLLIVKTRRSLEALLSGVRALSLKLLTER